LRPGAPLPHTAAFRARLAARLAGFARRALPLEGRRAAAVALIVAARPEAPGEAGFVLTRRAAGLRAHGGQYALPGGRLDPGEDAVKAALRETREEIGHRADPGDVLGLLDDYPTRSGYVVTPVVVWAGAGARFHPAEAEVAALEVLALSLLTDPETASFHSIAESPRPVIRLRLPWGHLHAPTAAMLHQLGEVVMGRDTRVADYEQPVFAWR